MEPIDYPPYSDFNPRTSCEVRLSPALCHCPCTIISIHAPRVRCDTLRGYRQVIIYISIHAPRVRCDDAGLLKKDSIQIISIHAPRVRCDLKFTPITQRSRQYFNPRTSCEVRRGHFEFRLLVVDNFNPRTSCEVRPTNPANHQLSRFHFNPRTSCEVRHKDG